MRRLIRIKNVLILFACLFVMAKGIHGQSGNGVREDPKTDDKTTYEYFIGGNQVSEEEFFKNNETGTKKTYKNGILIGVDELKEGRRHGKIISYYDNGKIERIQEYEYGKYYGYLAEWHENGQISTLGYNDSRYSDIGGRLVTWDKEGNLIKESIKVDARDRYIEWYKNGIKRAEGEYANHWKDGKSRSWYENGALAGEIETINGIDILHIHYYENGNKELEEYPIEGSNRKREIKYYKNGQLKSWGEKNSMTGERDGLWIGWQENGICQSMGMWREGRKRSLENLPMGPAAVYFPKELFYDAKHKEYDTIFMESYSRQLDALDEPVLYHSETIKEAYRFTFLRTHHEPVAVRIEKENGQVYLYVRMTDGKGGGDPGGLIVDVKKTLSLEQWNHFSSLINKLDYWKMKGRDKRVTEDKGSVTIRSDGADWILEGVNRGQYNLVFKWSPDENNEFRKCCEYLLELSDLNLKEIY